MEDLAVALALVLTVILITGCDGEAWERQQRRSELVERFWNACAAMGKERIVNEWQNGKLVCYAWDNKPGKHQTPAVVASKEDL